MGVGVKKRRGLWVDSRGRTLPSDNYMIVGQQKAEKSKSTFSFFRGTTRIVNPDVARDIRKGSYTFGGKTRLAAKRFTNKFKKERARIQAELVSRKNRKKQSVSV